MRKYYPRAEADLFSDVEEDEYGIPWSDESVMSTEHLESAVIYELERLSKLREFEKVRMRPYDSQIKQILRKVAKRREARIIRCLKELEIR